MESAQQAGDRLHEALFGKDKEEVSLNIIMNNNLSQRLDIAQYYSSAYNTSLYADIKSRLNSDFGKAVGYLFLSPLSFCSKMLKNAFRGLTLDETCIFEILSSKTLEERQLIETAYKKETGNDLAMELDNYFSGNLKTNVLNLLYTPRSTNQFPDKEECEKYANELITIGEKKWVEDDNIFKEIFLKKSPEELVCIARFYKNKTGKNMLDIINKNIKGKNNTLIKEVLFNNIMPHELYAEKVYLAIKGLGTDENLLTRVLVSRNEIDMAAIREIYKWKYEVDMKEDIYKDTSGFYQNLCVYLGEN